MFPRRSHEHDVASFLDAGVVVETENSTGSGTVVRSSSRNSYVLTCQHVVLTVGRRTMLIYREGKRVKRVSGVVEKIDENNDLALIRTSRRLPMDPVRIAEEPPDACDDVFVVGAPSNYTHVASWAIVSMIDPDDGDYQITGGVIAPGMSGGAVANDDGELVSVVHSVGRAGNLPLWGLGFGVPLDRVRKFLRLSK